MAQEDPVEKQTDAKTDKSASNKSKPMQGMVSVPASEFIYGMPDSEVDLAYKLCRQHANNPDACKRSWFTDEQPQKRIRLEEFLIDKYEVSHVDYKACVDAGVCSPPSTTSEYCSGDYAEHTNWGKSGRDNHPINCVSWTQAQEYCRWRGKRLPTEQEWEKAARGTDGRRFPWDNTWDGSKGNWGEKGGWGSQDGHKYTAPVGSYPQGVSPYGAHDMAGNVWEWTATKQGSKRVNRGGSFGSYASNLRASSRSSFAPSDAATFLGFRCAR